MTIETRINTGNDKELTILDEVRATLVDDGVEVYLKSPIIHDWAKRLSGGKTYEPIPGLHLYRCQENLPAWQWPFQVVTDSLRPEMLFWLFHTNLGEGVSIKYNTPVLLPADLNEYVNAVCEYVTIVYQKYIKKATVSAKVVRTND